MSVSNPGGVYIDVDVDMDMDVDVDMYMYMYMDVAGGGIWEVGDGRWKMGCGIIIRTWQPSMSQE
jgi:hypothetical protein